MNSIYRKSLIAGAISVFVATPVWAGGDKAEKAPEAGTSSQQMNQPGRTGAAAGTGASTAAATQLHNMTPREL